VLRGLRKGEGLIVLLSDEQEEKVVNLMRDGQTVETIMERFSISNRAVCKLRKKHNMATTKSVHWSKEEDALLTRLWTEEGLSASLTAERLSALGVDRTRNAVIGRVNRLGLEKRGEASNRKPYQRRRNGKLKKASKKRTPANSRVPGRVMPLDPPEVGEDWFSRAKLVMPKDKRPGHMIQRLNAWSRGKSYPEDAIASLSATEAALVLSKPGECRYPLENGVCGRPSVGVLVGNGLTSPYCREHHDKCYQPSKPFHPKRGFKIKF
jgi:hypothetical protein